MRWSMLSVEHCNDNAQESTNLRHANILPECASNNICNDLSEKNRYCRATTAIRSPFGLTAMRVMFFKPALEKSASSTQA